MTADLERITQARRMLTDLGLTVADVLSLDSPGRVVATMPTVAEYLPQVIAAAGPGATHTYDTYWTRMATRWGDRRLDEIAASEIEAMRRTTIATARKRRTSRSGRHFGLPAG